MFFEKCLNEMNMFLCPFQGVEFLDKLQLVATMVAPSLSSSPSLPCEGVSQTCFYDHLGEPPLRIFAYNTQTFHNLTHDFCDLIVLQHGLALLHHEGLEGVNKGQKFFGCLVCLFLVYSFLLCLERLAHIWTF